MQFLRTERKAKIAENAVLLRLAWRDDPVSFHGEFVGFDAIRVNPKPVHGRRIPVVVGGNSDAALRRAAAFGDGWYGFNLPAAAVAERLGALAGYCRDRGHEPTELSTAVALSDGTPGLLPELAESGVSELVVVGAPPADPARATAWVADLAARWMPGNRYRG